MDVINQIMSAKDFVAILGRDVDVRLLDLSGAGCLLESNSSVLVGTAGSLAVMIDGCEYADAIRVNRCDRIAGSSRYHVATEFLWTTKPEANSLRRLIARLRAAPGNGTGSVMQE